MAIQISIDQLNGTAVASAGTPDQRGIPGKSLVTRGTHVGARGVLTADEEGDVKFVPEDEDAFADVAAADGT
jgi:hypothetical protein